MYCLERFEPRWVKMPLFLLPYSGAIPECYSEHVNIIINIITNNFSKTDINLISDEPSRGSTVEMAKKKPLFLFQDGCTIPSWL